MENTNPGFQQDDWQLERPHYGRQLDDMDNRPSARGSGLIRQTTIIGSIIIVIIAVTFLVLDTVIKPVQSESKAIKEMISSLQNFRHSDISILQARFDRQEEVLRDLLKQVSELKAPALVANKAPSNSVNNRIGNTGKYTLYSVKKNDTLGGIARRHNVSVKRILEENEITNSHKISIGQEIYVPAQ
uniref:LysM domain-containing protein n=1 Tax=Candidatus Kentrum sp. TUN TaxID=2126343 RepID=A0A450ZP85_9GAMM|nr:MAG: LysM domain-containing protein [Candidatus Kentron sp. TUN]VFK56205.1 MAG: LysM domain-containing protein [Candidatus Kentron sp. TUN]VFK62448.1 MAG: LysM domain-containing protein [Candidatus Kentron sp. TUN]